MRLSAFVFGVVLLAGVLFGGNSANPPTLTRPDKVVAVIPKEDLPDADGHWTDIQKKEAFDAVNQSLPNTTMTLRGVVGEPEGPDATGKWHVSGSSAVVRTGKINVRFSWNFTFDDDGGLKKIRNGDTLTISGSVHSVQLEVARGKALSGKKVSRFTELSMLVSLEKCTIEK